MNLAPGSRLGPYEIVGLLGAGGMGEVYRARDPRLGRDVAIKVLPATFAADAERLQRFEQEARATAALNDPNIVAIYDVGTADGQPYVVTELLDGETLRAALADGPLPLRKALSLRPADRARPGGRAPPRHRPPRPEAREPLRHRRRAGEDPRLRPGQAHRGRAARSRSAMSTTAAGLVLGTVGYMSPEQARGELADHRADIFSFGAVLYEMLSGQRAFQGNSPVETLSAILKEQPPDLTLVVPGLSPALARIVDRCLEKKPRRPVPDRGRSAVRARSDLRRARRRRSVPRAAGACRGSGRRRAAAVALALGGGFALGRASPGPRAAALPAAHLPSRRRAGRAVRRRRPDHRLRGGVGRAADRAVLDPARRARSAAAADDRHGPLRDVVEGRDGGRARARRGSAASKARWPARRWPAARRGSWREGVLAADWRPDGSELAIVRSGSGKRRARVPDRPHALRSQPGPHHPHPRRRPAATPWPSSCIRCRATPPARWCWSTSRAARRTLSTGWNSVLGLAWSPDGQEVWFTGTRTGAAQAIHAVSRSRAGAAAAGGAGDAHAARRRRPTAAPWCRAMRGAPA